MTSDILKKLIRQDDDINIVVMPKAAKPTLSGRPKPAPRPKQK